MSAYQGRPQNFNHIGRTGGQWEQVGPTFNIGSNPAAVCLCRGCDRHFVVWMNQVTSGKSKQCISCGKRQHGMSHGHHRIYGIWSGMITRCHNPKARGYDRYGGAGIHVFPEWRGPGGFAAFYAHVGDRPSRAHQLDRIEGTKGYEPGNVRWVTQVENSRNRKTNRLLTIGGITKSLVEWSEMPGAASRTNIFNRLRIGWTQEESVFGKVVSCVLS
jgi:hypothetical protein